MLLLCYSLPSRLISFLLSFWHLLPLPNILKRQPLAGCFLTLIRPRARQVVGTGETPWSPGQCCCTSSSQPGAETRSDVLPSEGTTTRFSLVATNEFKCTYAYKLQNYFLVFSPLDENIFFKIMTNSMCLVSGQYSSPSLSSKAWNN